LHTGAAPAMAQALRVLERMGAQNAQHDVVMDYKVGLGQGCLCTKVQSPLLQYKVRCGPAGRLFRRRLFNSAAERVMWRLRNSLFRRLVDQEIGAPAAALLWTPGGAGLPGAGHGPPYGYWRALRHAPR